MKKKSRVIPILAISVLLGLSSPALGQNDPSIKVTPTTEANDNSGRWGLVGLVGLLGLLGMRKRNDTRA